MGKHKNGKQISVWISDELYKECEQNRIRGQKEINKTGKFLHIFLMQRELLTTVRVVL